MLEKYLEPIIEEFTTGTCYREVFEAKKEYFDKAGVVYEDDGEFEQRMSIFMDWYLFERDLPGVDLPPIRHYYRKQKETMSDDEVKIYEGLCNTVHSIFRLKRFTFRRRALVVEDLFTGKTYKVQDPHISHAFNKGDLFEGRLIPFKGKYQFSSGFCFHPVEMKRFIVREIKKVKHQQKSRQTKLVLQLSAMKLKHLRFNHIDVRHIYSFDSRL